LNNPCGILIATKLVVSILVLMDVAFEYNGLAKEWCHAKGFQSLFLWMLLLNSWMLTTGRTIHQVSILVLMDVAFEFRNL